MSYLLLVLRVSNSLFDFPWLQIAPIASGATFILPRGRISSIASAQEEKYLDVAFYSMFPLSTLIKL
jgi:hypothetical protein